MEMYGVQALLLEREKQWKLAVMNVHVLTGQIAVLREMRSHFLICWDFSQPESYLLC